MEQHLDRDERKSKLKNISPYISHLSFQKRGAFRPDLTSISDLITREIALQEKFKIFTCIIKRRAEVGTMRVFCIKLLLNIVDEVINNFIVYREGLVNKTLETRDTDTLGAAKRLAKIP